MSEKKFKKRGSTASLVAMLLILIALVVAIIMWPTEASAEASRSSVVQDDIAKTTLIIEGDKAPDFTVEMLDGSKVKLSSLRGKVVLINFWATWCPPCRQEMAHLQEGVIDHFAGRDVVVLPISRGEDRATVESFIKKMGYTFPVGLDSDQSIYRKYASNYVPRSVVIDRNGKVVYAIAGYDENVAREVQEAITAAL